MAKESFFLEVHFAAEEEFVEFSNGEWYFV